VNLNLTPTTQLSEWSEEWIKQILDQDLSEGYLYDFKADISTKDQSMAKTVTSFANTQGGFIIFGIKDGESATGWKRLHGVTDKKEFAKKLSDVLSNSKVVPTIFFEDPRFLSISRNNISHEVAIVKINSSEFKPHAVVGSDGLLKFWVRNNQTASAMTYPALTKAIEESTQLRNWLAALYLDTEYIESFANKMIFPEKERETTIPIVRINSIINSDQSSQIISIIPNDVKLVSTIWALREKIELVNSFRDMMIQRRALPLSNAGAENKSDNDRIAAIVPGIKHLASEIRQHLAEKYPKIREWLNVVQAQ